MYDIKESFKRVCICRTFKLSGFQEILKKFPTSHSSEPVMLLLIISELGREGYLTNTSEYCIVNREMAVQFKKQEMSPSFCDLHNAWTKWYQSIFQKSFETYDLANYLFHKFSHVSECSDNTTELYDSLISETEIKLWEYYKSNAEYIHNNPGTSGLTIHKALNILGDILPHPKRKEAIHYIRNLRGFIEDSRLFEDCLSESENRAYVTHLKSLEYR